MTLILWSHFGESFETTEYFDKCVDRLTSRELLLTVGFIFEANLKKWDSSDTCR